MVLPSVVLGNAYMAYTLPANRCLPSSFRRALGYIFTEYQTWFTAKKSDGTERNERALYLPSSLACALGKACECEQKKCLAGLHERVAGEHKIGVVINGDSDSSRRPCPSRRIVPRRDEEAAAALG